jgi:hypothetical protein
LCGESSAQHHDSERFCRENVSKVVRRDHFICRMSKVDHDSGGRKWLVVVMSDAADGEVSPICAAREGGTEVWTGKGLSESKGRRGRRATPVASAVLVLPPGLHGLSPATPFSPGSPGSDWYSGGGGEDSSFSYGTDPFSGSGFCDDWCFGSPEGFPGRGPGLF